VTNIGRPFLPAAVIANWRQLKDSLLQGGTCRGRLILWSERRALPDNTLTGDGSCLRIPVFEFSVSATEKVWDGGGSGRWRGRRQAVARTKPRRLIIVD